MSNGGDFSWCQFRKGFIQIQKEEEKFVVVCSRPPQNVALGGFHVVVAQWTSKKCTNKCNTRAEAWRAVVFVHKPIVFGRCRCRLRRGCYDVGDGGDGYGYDDSDSKD